MRKKKKKDLLSVRDLTRDEMREVFSMAKDIKLGTKDYTFMKPKTLALLFEKPSLRTRVTFEVAMFQLGGHTVFLDFSDIRLGEREGIHDVAKNLSLWVQCIAARTYTQKVLTDLSKFASVPVVNALSDLEHPCQALADVFTIMEHKGDDLKSLKLAYIGDGNNVCHSLLLASAKCGLNMSVATPSGFEPQKEFVQEAQAEARRTKVKIEVVHDPYVCVKGADVIYTDVWASMGQEHEYEMRLKIFKEYQVNKSLLHAAKKRCLVMHCLPAHRGEEVDEEVLESRSSIVFTQAENRLYVSKALLMYLLGAK